MLTKRLVTLPPLRLNHMNMLPAMNRHATGSTPAETTIAHARCRMRQSPFLSLAFSGGALALAVLLGCSAPSTGREDGGAAAGTQHVTPAPRLTREASVTVYPVSLAGQPIAQVGEVLGMLLERGGMEHLELSSNRVAQAADRTLAAASSAFADSIRAEPPATEFGLYCEFLGTPGQVAEVRTILASKSGEILWADSQTSKDADFRSVSPGEPMECCVLVSKRLTPVFALSDPMRADAPEGKLAQRWKRETALPDSAEESAIAARLKTLRSSLGTASISVFAPHAPKFTNPSSNELVQRITEAGFANVTSTEGKPNVSVRSGMNQQMVLWSFARSFGTWVGEHRPATDYVLHTDYLMSKAPNGDVGVIGVHLVICDKEGQLVLVDFQNDHQPDFKAVKPKTREECDELVARRMKALLK
jgi:hypothetical protein